MPNASSAVKLLCVDMGGAPPPLTLCVDVDGDEGADKDASSRF
eukprot:CAMPEP_0119200214 /NCGR_PEP_ID=MMETSP1316-20130426/25294_1 /TAXON_ID=41880 /ORGANISM="Pycnococcus provasolii, Strain RCC2336" /LENGTH=42 /DNA_ID= /DNA_START= /DNA_END= /DNA_ORIENTATION=